MKKKNNYFFIIIGMLFIIFISYIIAFNSGYYEFNNYKKATITQEKIDEFENDVKDGKNIDSKDYISNDYIDYSSKMSKVGSGISSAINKFIESGLSDFFSALGRLFV